MLSHPPSSVSRGLFLAALCLLLVPTPSVAGATDLDHGLGVFTSPLGTDKTGSLAPGVHALVFIKTDNVRAPFYDGMIGAQFGVDVDPRLDVLNRFPANDALLASEVGPDEWLVGLNTCIGETDSPYTLMTYEVRLKAGVTDTSNLRIGVRDLDAYGEPMLFATCTQASNLVRFTDAGDAVFNPSVPQVVHVSATNEIHVEGRALEVAWEVANSTGVTLDGATVDPTGKLPFSPTADTTYEVVATNGASTHSLQKTVEVIRRPRVNAFSAELFDTGSQVKVKLTWNTEGANSVSIPEASGNIYPIGSALVPLQNPPVWELTASNEWGPTTALASLASAGDDPPIILTFQASPPSFQSGDSVDLVWSIYNADNASIDLGVGAVDPVTGSATVSPPASAVYTLSATNANGTTTATATVQLLPAGIVSFDANPAAIYAGRTTTLSWEVESSADLSIAPDVGPVSGPTGSVVVTPPADNTIYTLTATNAEGSVSTDVLVEWLVPEASLAASDFEPFATEEITLTADVEGADTVTLEPGFGTIDPSGGSFPVTVESTTTFTLTATNAKGSRVRQVTITPQAPAATLTADNGTPLPGETVTLTAAIEGAVSATLEPGVGAIDPAGGAFDVVITEETLFTLTATNPAGTTVATVLVTPRPPVVGLTASNENPFPGEVVTLSASVAGASSASIDPEVGSIDPAGGDYDVSPTAPTTYTLSATNVSGTSTASVTVTPQVPDIAYFRAVPTTILGGSSSELQWDVAGADQIAIEPGGFVSPDATGGWSVSPLVTTEYTLTATNPAGDALATATVEVLPFTILSFTVTPQEITEPGDPVVLEWEVAGVGDVSIDGFGPQPMVGSLVDNPTASRTYTLRVTQGGISRSAIVSVQVGVPGAGSLVLSYSPFSVETDGFVTAFVPFYAYVLAIDPQPNILGFEFSLEYPACLILLSQVIPHQGALNVGNQGNFIVGLGQCVQPQPILPLLEMYFLPVDPNPSCVQFGEISLGPTTPSSFIVPSPGFVDCQSNLIPFDVGPPLSLSGSGGGVAVLSMDLQVEPREEGLELRWDIPTGIPAENLLLLRGEDEPTDVVAQWDGAAVRRNGSWTDSTAEPGRTYQYKAVARAGPDTYLSPQKTGTWTPRADRTRAQLLPNVPNPFNPQTTLRFVMPSAGDARLQILDLAGREVWEQSRSGLEAGEHQIVWNGRDQSGRTVSSGVYLVQLTTAEGRDTQRIALLK